MRLYICQVALSYIRSAFTTAASFSSLNPFVVVVVRPRDLIAIALVRDDLEHDGDGLLHSPAASKSLWLPLWLMDVVILKAIWVVLPVRGACATFDLRIICVSEGISWACRRRGGRLSLWRHESFSRISWCRFASDKWPRNVANLVWWRHGWQSALMIHPHDR